MRYFKNLIVLIGLLSIHAWSFAGAYDDFFKALTHDDVGTVQALVQRGFDPNTVGPEGLPALVMAVREPSLKVAEFLAAWPDTRVNLRNEHDENVLMLAALKGHRELVNRLIGRRAEVNKEGWTALHYASTGAHLPVMALLIGAGAQVDALSPNGTTPLMMAAHYGNAAAVKLLLEAGAHPQLKNQLGLSALDFARSADRPDSVKLLSQP
jgi:ankyrin repeat protein